MPPESLAADGDGSHLTLLVYVGVALGVSFLCSVWEAVLLSTPVSHLQLMADQGRRGGRRLLQLRSQVEQPISAILTLNTIAHTVGAAGAGAEATLIFGSRWFGVISAVLTVLILVLSEIVPKTLGTAWCRQLAGLTGHSLHVLVRVLRPVVAVLDLLTRMLRPSRRGPSVTRAELQALARLSAAEGGLQEEEGRILDNLLELEQVRVREVMTPRTMMLALPRAMTVGEVLANQGSLPYSRIPLYGSGPDDIHGYALRHDILEQAAADRHALTLEELARPLHAVPEGSTVARALQQFISERDHLFLVVDEYGGTAGLITLEDALETLLGREIVDESDRVADLAALARRRYERHLQRMAALRAAREAGGGGTPPQAPRR